MNNRFIINLEELSEVKPEEAEIAQVEVETPEENIVEDVSPTEDDEHQRLALELDELQQDLYREGEVSEGLESLAYIASKLDKPTKDQVALFRVAANFAVMGTKKSAEDFLPPIHSNKPIAMEGFVDSVKETIKNIIEKLKEWWKKFLEFVDKNIFSLKTKKEKFEEAAKKLEEDEKLKEQKEVIFKIHHSLLTEEQNKLDRVTLRDIESNILEVYKLKPIFDEFAKGYNQLVDNAFDSLKNIKSKDDFIQIKSDIIKKFNEYTQHHLKNKIKTDTDFISVGTFNYKNYNNVDFDEFGFRIELSGENKLVDVVSTGAESKKFIDHINKNVLLDIEKSQNIYDTLDTAYKEFSVSLKNINTDEKLNLMVANFLKSITHVISNTEKLYFGYNKVLGNIYHNLTVTFNKVL